MAITQDDFKKIWASTSSVPEYTFSDSDYQDGWEFVGNLPPTRAMWDTLQRRNDQKMKFLQNKTSMSFDSVADMVDADIDEGQVVFTKGYNSINDGGSSFYNVRAKDVSDVDDGANIIFLDNGNVAEKLINTESVLDDLPDTLDLERCPFFSALPFDSFKSTQGMCIAGKYLIESVWAGDASQNRLYVIDIDNKNVVGYVEYAMGHMNSVFYDADNKLVCVCGTNADVYRFSLADDGTITHHSDVTAPINLSSMAWFDGKFYGKNAENIYIGDSIETIEYALTLNTTGMGDLTGRRQDLDVDEHFIYHGVSSLDPAVERLCIFDKNNGSLLKTYEIPRGRFGEIEATAIRNGWLYINFNHPATDSILAVYRVPLYRSTPIGNDDLDNLRSDVNDQTSSNYTSVYVNNSNVFAFPDGSVEKQFNSLYGAILLMLHRQVYSIIFVSGTYEDISLVGINKLMNFDFNNATVTGQMSITRSLVRVANIKCKNLRVEQSVVSIIGGTIDGNNDVENIIQNYRGYITGYCTGTGWTNKAIVNNQGITNISIPNVTVSNVDTFSCINGKMICAGGEMSNTLIFSATSAIGFNTNDGEMYIIGGTDSTAPLIAIRGKNKTTDAGSLYIRTRDSSYTKALIAKPDGTLTWNGQPIQVSSDKRLKQDFANVPDEVLEAWEKVDWKQFKYTEDAEKKGSDNCRWHTGLVAQDVKEIGEANHVDLLKYGILCHDVREATEDEEAVDLWTIRYEEALAMEAIYQRKRADKLEARIEALEKLLNK